MQQTRANKAGPLVHVVTLQYSEWYDSCPLFCVHASINCQVRWRQRQRRHQQQTICLATGLMDVLLNSAGSLQAVPRPTLEILRLYFDGCGVMQIKVRSALAVPHQKHRGSPMEALMVRAVTSFGSQQRDAFDNVAIRCGGLSPLQKEASATVQPVPMTTPPVAVWRDAGPGPSCELSAVLQMRGCGRGRGLLVWPGSPDLQLSGGRRRARTDKRVHFCQVV